MSVYTKQRRLISVIESRELISALCNHAWCQLYFISECVLSCECPFTSVFSLLQVNMVIGILVFNKLVSKDGITDMKLKERAGYA